MKIREAAVPAACATILLGGFVGDRIGLKVGNESARAVEEQAEACEYQLKNEYPKPDKCFDKFMTVQKTNHIDTDKVPDLSNKYAADGPEGDQQRQATRENFRVAGAMAGVALLVIAAGVRRQTTV